MFDSIFNNLVIGSTRCGKTNLFKAKSVAVVGPIRSGKTQQLSILAEELISQGKKVCVIEVNELSSIPERMTVDQENVTHFNPIQDEFPGEVKQLMFLQIPMIAIQNQEEVFDSMLIENLLKHFDVLLVDETKYALRDLIAAGMFKDFVKTCIESETDLVVTAHDLRQLNVAYEEFVFHAIVRGCSVQENDKQTKGQWVL